MSFSRCLSCCAACSVSQIRRSISPSPNPYDLQRLLPVGTIQVSLPVDFHHHLCNHIHPEDGWHSFEPDLALPHLSLTEDIAFVQGLAFLMRQQFVSSTYHSAYDGMMVLRIYLIPYDLGNVHGKLRIRKENVLAPSRRYLRALVQRISQSHEMWNGLEPKNEEHPLITNTKDARTLADIYSDLSSPLAVPVPGYGEISSRLLDFDDELEGLGMRSKLYRYQRRSVATMLHKELDLQDVPDPLYIPVTTMDNRTFYLQPGTMEILNERPITAPCRGGILCEELGTGKTVMMLCLILATRNQISSPEPSIVDERPIITPLALRYFPDSEFARARQCLSPRRVPDRLNAPSLVEILLHHSRTSPNCAIPINFTNKQYVREMEKEANVDTLPLSKMLLSSIPFYHHYPIELRNRERVQRSKLVNRPRRIYLTSATLIVVPSNLLSQWDREIAKHCYIPLRVLILRAKTPVPTVKRLATDFDIILMSYTRFSSEANNRDLSKMHAQGPCKCPEFSGYRVPDCVCHTPDVSKFLQIRWKRLIIDEGHVSSTLSTILVPFAKLLSVERRWIVTGTPTTNLLGLSLGNVFNELENGLENESQSMANSDRNPSPTHTEEVAFEYLHEADYDMSSSQISSDGDISLSPRVSPSPSSQTRSASRIWNRYDREDLTKLGNMITHFIAMPQFSSDTKLISTHVTEPLLDPSGPRPGAIQVLNQLMAMVMIRHRIEDVEQEVLLPPVVRESVLLDLDPFVIKSFNALQAMITINAIDSQRTDQDYMFHPRNADALQETVKNMSQILFWHVNNELYNGRSLLEHSESDIRKTIERNMPEEDITALRNAFAHIQLAMDDPLWKTIQTHEDVPYRVFNLNENIFNAWTRTPGKEPCSDPSQSGFLHADRLLKLHDVILQQPWIMNNENQMIDWGKTIAHRDRQFRQAYEESLRKKGKGRKKAKHTEDITINSQMAENFAKKASAADTLREMQKDLDASLARLEKDEDEDTIKSPPDPSKPVSILSLPTSSAVSLSVAKTQIGSSASTKLNYIINEVQKYSANEKFLIFSESPLSLAHVAEALELIQVKFLRFTAQIAPQFREQLVLTFETSETYRVFLMELKHGARGLNLISASRVIFCEPVWQADVESQAIKRAHRIGQTRQITVKTLAIRETAEENMVQRRMIVKKTQEKLPKLIEEAGMRHYIANPKFITRPPVITPIEDCFPLVHVARETAPRPHPIMLRIPTLPRSPASKRIRVEDPVDDDPPAEDGSPHRKRVTF